MTSWNAYPKVSTLGHPSNKDLLDGPVVIQEKVDGSQLSFGIFDGEIKIRSRGRVFDIHAPHNLFERAAETVQELAPLLIEGWTYRGEYLHRPKHNTLAYEKVPPKHIILFDVNTKEEEYLTTAELHYEAKRLGLMSVPTLLEGVLYNYDQLEPLLETISVLGNAKIEGVVVKNYNRFGPDDKILTGKHVREDFKERNTGNWKKCNPSNKDVLTTLAESFKTEARWEKAIQHIEERGELEGTPRDIGALVKEVQMDIADECSDEIKDTLYAWAIKTINRTAVRGLPEWYKRRLLTELLRKD